MTKPVIVTRTTKNAALTYEEQDQNFINLRDATVSVTAGTGGTKVTSDLNGNITLVAGTGITLTGNNTAKTITITNNSLGANAFGKIVVAGQSDVDADSASDTLTLVAGSNITLTTNASTDSITINSTSSGLTSVEQDLTPKLGGNLDVNNKTISNSLSDSVNIVDNVIFTQNGQFKISQITGSNRIECLNDFIIGKVNTFGGSVGQSISFGSAFGNQSMTIGVGGNNVNDSVIIVDPIRIKSLSQTQINNILVNVSRNGMLVYNSSTHKFQGQANGVWVNLH